MMKQAWGGWQAFLATAVLAGVASVGVTAQNASLSAERTVDYRTGKTIDLRPLQVGPVRIHSVEFQNMGRGYSSGGFASKMKGAATTSEASTTIRAHFLAENPSSDEWEVTFILEYRDKDGKLIDRVTRKNSWEGEAKPFDFDHPLIEYVLPDVAQVKIKLEARLD